MENRTIEELHRELAAVQREADDWDGRRLASAGRAAHAALQRDWNLRRAAAIRELLELYESEE